MPLDILKGENVPTLDEVYQKFGFTAEAAQLLETELGNVLLLSAGVEHGWFIEPDGKFATELHDAINRSTLGQLFKRLEKSPLSLSDLETLFSSALRERNRLFHHFYRQHNFRRNSEEGRAIMWIDLNSIHETLHRAYKAVMMSGS
jgi:hypothetical protein